MARLLINDSPRMGYAAIHAAKRPLSRAYEQTPISDMSFALVVATDDG